MGFVLKEQICKEREMKQRRSSWFKNRKSFEAKGLVSLNERHCKFIETKTSKEEQPTTLGLPYSWGFAII